jgi:hypothetical protein
MQPAFYDITDTTFFGFSDEEGGAPFHLDDIQTDQIAILKGSIANKTVVHKKLNECFIFTNGIITHIKDGVSMGFMGDLVDNSIKSIRVLQQMIQMKEDPTLSNRIILIGGNRDYNKIRMGIELFFTIDNELPWKWCASLTELKTRLEEKTAEFRQKDLPDYVSFLGAQLKSEVSSGYMSEHDPFKTRIEKMMTKTMGFSHRNVLDELEALKLIPSNEENEENAKMVAVIQMIMSFEWDIEEIPVFLRPYIGLYPKYLRLSHVVAAFKHGEDYGIMSHSGYVPLTSPLALNPVGIKLETPLLEMLGKIEEEKNTMVNQLRICMDTRYNYNLNKTPINRIIKFVQITAPVSNSCGDSCGHKYSPIIGGPKLEEIKVDIGNRSMGGGWDTEDMNSEKYKIKSGETVIKYNIYGHMPKCFFPSLKITGDTKHICLDVSKIEGPTNNNSFAFLMIEDGNASFIGRTYIVNNPSPSHIYKKYIYYAEKIKDADLDHENPRNGIKVKCNGPPTFDRTITIPSSGGRKTRRFRKNKTRRFRKNKTRRSNN